MKIFGLNITRNKKIKNFVHTPENTIENYTIDFLNGLNDGRDRQMKIAVVFRCIDFLSDTISMLPFFVIDDITHINPEDRYSRQIEYLLNCRPNRNMTPSTFFKIIEKDRLSTGNGFAEIKWADNGLPLAYNYLHPRNVLVKQEDDGEVLYDVTDPKTGDVRTLLCDEILHFKGISDDGIIGKSVLSYARETIAGMEFQEKFFKTFYESGGRPSGVLSFDTDLSTLAIKRNKDDIHGIELRNVLRDSFQKQVGGSNNAGKVAITDLGSKYTAIQPITQKDMAFVESKELSIADIARFFGVPLYKLFTGKESYQSNEQNNIAFVTDKLNPIVTGYEQELTYKLFIPERQRAGISIKANLNVLLRGDIEARSKFYERMRNVGAMSVNDIRRKEDMGDVAGGDVRLVSWNYAPLDRFEEMSENRNSARQRPTEG